MGNLRSALLVVSIKFKFLSAINFPAASVVTPTAIINLRLDVSTFLFDVLLAIEYEKLMESSEQTSIQSKQFIHRL